MLIWLSITITLAYLSYFGNTTPVIEYDKGLRYEEYVIEHEISGTQARNAVKSIDLASITSPPGCQECTKEERHYCSSADLINDHCCCDKRFAEPYPFIPHTCYFGTVLCKTIAADCEDYNRIKACCCDKYVLQIWRNKLMHDSHSNSSICKMTLSNLFYVIYLIALGITL